MPKRKNISASDDEDGLSAENEATDAESSSAAEAAKTTSKKAKTKKSTAPPPKKVKNANHLSSISTADEGTDGVKVLTDSEGNKYIELGKKKRATVRSFKGVMLLDIREYYGADGDEKPGKKGISLTLEQWDLLRQGSSNIDKLFLQKKEATTSSS